MRSSSYKTKNTSVKAQKNTLIQMYSDERLLILPPFPDIFQSNMYNYMILLFAI